MTNFLTLPSMVPTLTSLSKLINSLSFYLTTSVNSVCFNKCQNCEANKYFILSLSKNCENISFSLTAGIRNKSATVITEKQANIFQESAKIVLPTLNQYLPLNHMIP